VIFGTTPGLVAFMITVIDAKGYASTVCKTTLLVLPARGQ
jgi:hypothetical protein